MLKDMYLGIEGHTVIGTGLHQNRIRKLVTTYVVANT